MLLGFVLSTLEDEAAVEALAALRESVATVGAPILIADVVLDDRESDRAKLPDGCSCTWTRTHSPTYPFVLEDAARGWWIHG